MLPTPKTPLAAARVEIEKLRRINKRLMEVNRQLRTQNEVEPPEGDPWEPLVEKFIKGLPAGHKEFATAELLAYLRVPNDGNRNIEEGRRITLIMQRIAAKSGKNWRGTTNYQAAPSAPKQRGFRLWPDDYVPKKRVRRTPRF